MTALATVIPRAETLYIERMKVVLAKEKRPLEVVHSVNFTHGKQVGCRYSQRARVADLPQRGRALHIGVGSERAMSATGTVNAVRIREGTLVVSEVAHVSHG